MEIGVAQCIALYKKSHAKQSLRDKFLTKSQQNASRRVTRNFSNGVRGQTSGVKLKSRALTQSIQEMVYKEALELG